MQRALESPGASPQTPVFCQSKETVVFGRWGPVHVRVRVDEL
jgi:hypothetical protein